MTHRGSKSKRAKSKKSSKDRQNTDRLQSGTKISKPVSDNPTLGEQLDMISARLSKLESGYDAALCKGIAKSAEIGWILEGDPKERKRFCRDPYWKLQKSRPNVKRPKDMIRFAIKRASPADRNQQQNASFYYRAVQYHLGAGVDLDNLEAELHRVGLRESARLGAEKNRQARGETVSTRKKLGEVGFIPPGRRLKEERLKREHREALQRTRVKAVAHSATLFADRASRFNSIPKNCRLWLSVTITEFGKRCEADVHQWIVGKPDEAI